MDETSFPIAKSRNARLIAYKAFADVAGKGSLFVITIGAARRLSPEAFGTFSLGSTLGWIVAVVADGGIQLHLARAVARRPAEASQLLRGWLRVRLWMTAAALAIVAAALAIASSPASAAPMAILALVYACSGLIELLHYFYRGLSRSDVESTLTLWQRGGTLVCGLIALAWRPDVTVLAIAMLIPVAVTLAASVRFAIRLAPEPPVGSGVSVDRLWSAPATAADTAVDGHVAGPRFDVFRRDVWPIGAGIVLSALYFRIDVFLVQLWSGTEAVALYNAVFRLVEALRLFPAAVLAVALPSLARAADARPLIRAAVPVTVFGAAAAAVLWVMADRLIPLVYGPTYSAAVPAFRILLLSLPFLSLNYALTHQIIGWDGQRAYAALCAVALAVNIAVNSRLIPLQSIEGAAWATLATEMVLTAGCGAVLWSLRSAAGTAPLATEA